jgi:hypothetical protein
MPFLLGRHDTEVDASEFETNASCPASDDTDAVDA